MQTVYTLIEVVALTIKAETQLDQSKVVVKARNSFDNNWTAVNKGKALMTQPSFSNTTHGTSNNRCLIKPVNTVSSSVQCFYCWHWCCTFSRRQHKAGRLNHAADALSQKALLLVILRNEVTGFDYLKELYEGDGYFHDIWARCQAGLYVDGLHIQKGYLFQGNQLRIPRSLL
ncbi:hypothetical protein POTOM_031048 [Populus tomentosa]|uniref:Uncharacterized protein n=1 Tax=Populus tomentosa TaxID=118781 RepID=A0A8X7Z7M9_POPTO|nr:hypothetical protein POTOM_031048 [Populus tomentosa]